MGRFDELSDLDFEELVADLMRAELELPFRAGTRGRDAGVDVLAVEGDEEHVVQCKHYKDSTTAKLLAAAREEAEKLEASGAEFTSYRFATSRRLNHARRQEIADILDPWVRSADEVYGEGDLKRLLRRHPRVEGAHVKLWLSGAGPLEQLLNAGAYERSRALLEETKDSLPRLVQTEAFAEALEILRSESICVIAGSPGVGKTTLARLLLLNGLEEEFQPYEIVPGGLKDAWELLALDEKQLFYFDDFLGQTALHESRHHDAELLRLIRKIARTPGRRFVLATREYILRQARQLSEALDRESEDTHRFLLTIEHYSRQEKARIFYNHIYFSENVDETARRSLLDNRSYLRIIDHPSYNPRMIEWLTGWSGHELSVAEKGNYTEFCLSVLDNPEPLWTHAFEQGLREGERALLVCLLGLPRRVSEADAERAFGAACVARSIELTEQRFVRSMSGLVDSFLSSDGGGGSIYLSFINPSVIDFLRVYLLSSRADAELAIDGAHFFEQVEWLWGALSGDGEAPSADLAGAFSRALERTLWIAAPEGSVWWAQRLRWNQSEGTRIQGRLGLILSFAEALPELGAEMVWLKAAAERWLMGIERGDTAIDSSTPRLLAELAKVTEIDLAKGARSIRGQIEQMNVDVDRWEYLSDLHYAIPGAFTDADWEKACSAFSEYLEYAVEEPGAYLSSPEEIGTLEDLVTYFDAVIEDDLFDRARETMAEETDEESEPDDDYYGDRERESADFGESDEDIDALFSRLV
jgi:hypothetical protein